MAEIKKYLDTTALGALVDQIKAEDAKVKAYADAQIAAAGKTYDAAGAAATAESNAKAYTDELANGQVATNKADIAKLNGDANTEGSVAKAVADAKSTLEGTIGDVDAKADKNAEDIATINNAESGILAQAKTYADGKASEVQGNVDTLSETVADLDAYVGDIPEGYTETNVIAYINKKAEETLNSASGGSTESAASVKAALDTEVARAKAAEEANAKAASDAQAAADAAQEHSEGVAADLATEVTNRTNADNALDERISDLEGTIIGLSGAMHFEGVKETVPEDVTGYEQGDVIIVGNKEYVLNGEAFVEFGDASVNAEAITALTGRMDTAEGKITALEGASATHALKTEVEAVSDALDEYKTAHAGDYTNAQIDAAIKVVADDVAALGDTYATDEELAQAIEAAKTDASNKDAVVLSEAQKAAGAVQTALDTHTDNDDIHVTAEQKTSWTTAAGKAHEHDNKTVLDGITSDKVAVWDAAEGNAKTYADGLNTAMTTKVDGVDNRVKVLEEAAPTYALDADLDDAVERIAANETAIAANTSAINSFTPITADEVNALFA